MPDIIETQDLKPLPPITDLKKALFSDAASDIWGRYEHWEQHGENGADRVHRVVYISAIKDVLENRHPVHEAELTLKDWDHLAEQHDFLMSHEETDFMGRKKHVFHDKYIKRIEYSLKKWYPKFLTQGLRETAVKLHARGNSTVNVIKYLLSPSCTLPNPFYYLNSEHTYLEKPIITWLTPRLAYLRLGTHAFPKKYNDLWHEEREAYLEEIRGVPLTETVEQVKALSELYATLEDSLNKATTDRGKAMLSASMVKVMSGLYTLCRDPSIKPPKSLSSQPEISEALEGHNHG